MASEHAETITRWTETVAEEALARWKTTVREMGGDPEAVLKALGRAG